MAWWHRFSAPKVAAPSEHLAYSVAFSLYTANGSRGIEVRVRHDGRAYFVEMEHVEGTIWKERGRGDEIGPYESPEAAEAAAIVSPWFKGGYISN